MLIAIPPLVRGAPLRSPCPSVKAAARVWRDIVAWGRKPRSSRSARRLPQSGGGRLGSPSWPAAPSDRVALVDGLGTSCAWLVRGHTHLQVSRNGKPGHTMCRSRRSDLWTAGVAQVLRKRNLQRCMPSHHSRARRARPETQTTPDATRRSSPNDDEHSARHRSQAAKAGPDQPGVCWSWHDRARRGVVTPGGATLRHTSQPPHSDVSGSHDLAA